jgi:regulator of sigma E protease
MEILIKAAQLLLSLSILVILHELGHFIPAKLFKTKVEKFYLFFDAGFSLFKKKIGQTEYGIGWLPLGGYVKIAGMIDESMDTEQMKKPAEDWEFRAKPAWQRLIIMLGGVTVNVILAFVIYICTFMAWGEQYLPTENATHGIYCDSLGTAAGFQNGDLILTVDGQKVDRFSQVIPEIILNDAQEVEVMREGQIETVPLSEEVKTAMLGKKSLFTLGVPFIINDFSKNSIAEEAGFQVGDQVLSINGEKAFLNSTSNYLKDHAGDSLSFLVQRGEEQLTYDLVLPEGAMGVVLEMPSDLFEYKQVEYTLAEAIPAGFKRTGVEISRYLKQFKLIKKSPESLGGFITIGNIFPAQWDWQRFWGLTAFLSIMLAVLNVLPIPALDGGHVVFLLYEVVTGRKPHEKVLEYAQITGMLLLFALLIYANGNDIIRLFT